MAEVRLRPNDVFFHKGEFYRVSKVPDVGDEDVGRVENISEPSRRKRPAVISLGDWRRVSASARLIPQGFLYNDVVTRDKHPGVLYRFIKYHKETFGDKVYLQSFESATDETESWRTFRTSIEGVRRAVWMGHIPIRPTFVTPAQEAANQSLFAGATDEGEGGEGEKSGGGAERFYEMEADAQEELLRERVERMKKSTSPSIMEKVREIEARGLAEVAAEEAAKDRAVHEAETRNMARPVKSYYESMRRNNRNQVFVFDPYTSNTLLRDLKDEEVKRSDVRVRRDMLLRVRDTFGASVGAAQHQDFLMITMVDLDEKPFSEATQAYRVTRLFEDDGGGDGGVFLYGFSLSMQQLQQMQQSKPAPPASITEGVPTDAPEHTHVYVAFLFVLPQDRVEEFEFGATLRREILQRGLLVRQSRDPSYWLETKFSQERFSGNQYDPKKMSREDKLVLKGYQNVWEDLPDLLYTSSDIEHERQRELELFFQTLDNREAYLYLNAIARALLAPEMLARAERESSGGNRQYILHASDFVYGGKVIVPHQSETVYVPFHAQTGQVSVSFSYLYTASVIARVQYRLMRSDPPPLLLRYYSLMDHGNEIKMDEEAFHSVAGFPNAATRWTLSSDDSLWLFERHPDHLDKRVKEGGGGGGGGNHHHYPVVRYVKKSGQYGYSALNVDAADEKFALQEHVDAIAEGELTLHKVLNLVYRDVEQDVDSKVQRYWLMVQSNATDPKSARTVNTQTKLTNVLEEMANMQDTFFQSAEQLQVGEGEDAGDDLTLVSRPGTLRSTRHFFQVMNDQPALRAQVIERFNEIWKRTSKRNRTPEMLLWQADMPQSDVQYETNIRTATEALQWFQSVVRTVGASGDQFSERFQAPFVEESAVEMVVRARAFGEAYDQDQTLANSAHALLLQYVDLHPRLDMATYRQRIKYTHVEELFARPVVLSEDVKRMIDSMREKDDKSVVADEQLEDDEEEATGVSTGTVITELQLGDDDAVFMQDASQGYDHFPSSRQDMFRDMFAPATTRREQQFLEDTAKKTVRMLMAAVDHVLPLIEDAKLPPKLEIATNGKTEYTIFNPASLARNIDYISEAFGTTFMSVAAGENVNIVRDGKISRELVFPGWTGQLEMLYRRVNDLLASDRPFGVVTASMERYLHNLAKRHLPTVAGISTNAVADLVERGTRIPTDAFVDAVKGDYVHERTIQYLLLVSAVLRRYQPAVSSGILQVYVRGASYFYGGEDDPTHDDSGRIGSSEETVARALRELERPRIVEQGRTTGTAVVVLVPGVELTNSELWSVIAQFEQRVQRSETVSDVIEATQELSDAIMDVENDKQQHQATFTILDLFNNNDDDDDDDDDDDVIFKEVFAQSPQSPQSPQSSQVSQLSQSSQSLQLSQLSQLSPPQTEQTEQMDGGREIVEEEGVASGRRGAAIVASRVKYCRSIRTLYKESRAALPPDEHYAVYRRVRNVEGGRVRFSMSFQSNRRVFCESGAQEVLMESALPITGVDVSFMDTLRLEGELSQFCTSLGLFLGSYEEKLTLVDADIDEAFLRSQIDRIIHTMQERDELDAAAAGGVVQNRAFIRRVLERIGSYEYVVASERPQGTLFKSRGQQASDLLVVLKPDKRFFGTTALHLTRNPASAETRSVIVRPDESPVALVVSAGKGERGRITPITLETATLWPWSVGGVIGHATPLSDQQQLKLERLIEYVVVITPDRTSNALRGKNKAGQEFAHLLDARMHALDAESIRRQVFGTPVRSDSESSIVLSPAVSLSVSPPSSPTLSPEKPSASTTSIYHPSITFEAGAAVEEEDREQRVEDALKRLKEARTLVRRAREGFAAEELIDTAALRELLGRGEPQISPILYPMERDAFQEGIFLLLNNGSTSPLLFERVFDQYGEQTRSIVTVNVQNRTVLVLVEEGDGGGSEIALFRRKRSERWKNAGEAEEEEGLDDSEMIERVSQSAMAFFCLKDQVADAAQRKKMSSEVLLEMMREQRVVQSKRHTTLVLHALVDKAMRHVVYTIPSDITESQRTSLDENRYEQLSCVINAFCDRQEPVVGPLRIRYAENQLNEQGDKYPYPRPIPVQDTIEETLRLLGERNLAAMHFASLKSFRDAFLLSFKPARAILLLHRKAYALLRLDHAGDTYAVVALNHFPDSLNRQEEGVDVVEYFDAAVSFEVGANATVVYEPYKEYTQTQHHLRAFYWFDRRIDTSGVLRTSQLLQVASAYALAKKTRFEAVMRVLERPGPLWGIVLLKAVLASPWIIPDERLPTLVELPVEGGGDASPYSVLMQRHTIFLVVFARRDDATTPFSYALMSWENAFRTRGAVRFELDAAEQEFAGAAEVRFRDIVQDGDAEGFMFGV